MTTTSEQFVSTLARTLAYSMRTLCYAAQTRWVSPMRT